MILYRALFILLVAIVCCSAAGLERPEVTYKIFQFPADQIPRVDGKTDDWGMVPTEYTIGTDQLVDDNAKGNSGFWNLSRKHTMYGNASQLCAFKLMPLEPQFRKSIEAQWSFKVVDMDRRPVAFKDLSKESITSWRWDFGDGEISTEQNPIHQYHSAGNIVVVLDVADPAVSLGRIGPPADVLKPGNVRIVSYGSVGSRGRLPQVL